MSKWWWTVGVYVAGVLSWSAAGSVLGDNHVLGYEAVTTLERQEHLSSRLKLVASLTKCLSGPRVQEFFRLHSAGYVGDRHLIKFGEVDIMPAELNVSVSRYAQSG
jgi:hypothetical protein